MIRAAAAMTPSVATRRDSPPAITNTAVIATATANSARRA